MVGCGAAARGYLEKLPAAVAPYMRNAATSTVVHNRYIRNADHGMGLVLA
jgi:hypothetical protein